MVVWTGDGLVRWSGLVLGFVVALCPRQGRTCDEDGGEAGASRDVKEAFKLYPQSRFVPLEEHTRNDLIVDACCNLCPIQERSTRRRIVVVYH
jgi:hypothetical protein